MAMIFIKFHTRFQSERRRICLTRFEKKQLNMSLLRVGGQRKYPGNELCWDPPFYVQDSELAIIIADT